MIYVSWALFAEGQSDADYLAALLPRLLQHLIISSDRGEGIVPDTPVEIFGIGLRNFDETARLICQARDAIQIVFVHGDCGGRAVSRTIERRTGGLCQKLFAECGFPTERCVTVTPNRETESWTLADAAALRAVFGLGHAANLTGVPSLPRAVENIADPKDAIQAVLADVVSPRRVGRARWPFGDIGAAQNIDTLCEVPSFSRLREDLRAALTALGFRYL